MRTWIGVASLVVFLLTPAVMADDEDEFEAAATKVKPVEVVNDPLLVEVTNLPPPVGASRFYLVGFTNTQHLGDLGGPFGANAKCQAEFPESHMCSLDEIASTTTPPAELTGTAWAHEPPLNSSVVQFSAEIRTWIGGDNCGAWTSFGGRGTYVEPNGSSPSPGSCTVPRSIACCARVP